jgi:putative aldouronate transport system permease protein
VTDAVIDGQRTPAGAVKKPGMVKSFFINLIKNRMFLFMVLPGAVYVLIMNYLPMPGVIMGFQRMSLAGGNIVKNILNSKWVGLDNFSFFFKSPDAFNVTRNTILYNIAFIALGLISSVFVAVAASEIHNRKLTKFYQTIMILPAFLSWVIVSYLLYSFLNPSFGAINTMLKDRGLDTVDWYGADKYWPVIIPFLNLWKNVGLSSIYYFAAISGIDQEMYQSAQLDGASRWKQIWYITIPSLRSTMVILTILNLGNIIRTDIGLFYVATLQMGGGALYKAVSTIDTYVYVALMRSGQLSLGAAVGFFQSFVGLIMVVGVNLIVRRIDKDSAMF